MCLRDPLTLRRSSRSLRSLQSWFPAGMLGQVESSVDFESNEILGDAIPDAGLQLCFKLIDVFTIVELHLKRVPSQGTSGQNLDLGWF